MKNKLSNRGRNIGLMGINILSGGLWIHIGRQQLRGWRLLNESIPWTTYAFFVLGIIQLLLAIGYMKKSIQE